jgi:hypothetical protein
LVTLASSYDSTFTNGTEEAILLTPYATAYRYPGESSAIEPTRTEFDDALKAAQELFAFVLNAMPKELHPG